jgi:uncharacterized damage-inducible protein DinB
MFTREALNDLVDYTDFTWETYGKLLRRLPDGALARPLADAGWPALRNVLFHLATAWDDFLRDRLSIEDPLDDSPDAVASWSDLQERRDKIRGWLKRVIDEASDDDLHAQTLPMWEGTPGEMRVSLADVLAHILLHERGHHGDVTTILSQLGATIPGTDYLVYVFFKQRQAKA